MDIMLYGTPTENDFISKTIYRFWSGNVNDNGTKLSIGKQNKQTGRFLRANGADIQIHGEFELKEPHVYNHGKPYSLNIDDNNGESYEFMSQHVYKNDAYHGRLVSDQLKFTFKVDGTHSTTFSNSSEFKLYKLI